MNERVKQWWMLDTSDQLRHIGHKMEDNANSSLTKVLLLGNSSFDTNDNTKIINWAINYVLLSKKIDGSLMLKSWFFYFLSQWNNCLLSDKRISRWRFFYLSLVFLFPSYFRYSYLNSMVFNVAPCIPPVFRYLMNVSLFIILHV